MLRETAARPDDDLYLLPALLTEAAADTRRTCSARGHCAQADPEPFFPHKSPGQDQWQLLKPRR